MKALYFLFIIFIAFISCKQNKQQATKINTEILQKKTTNEDRIREIDSLVQYLVDKKQTAGVSYAIQIGDDAPIIKNFGFANVEKKQTISTSSAFRIASITKSFTATAIVQLIEAGKLHYEDKLHKFFPDFPNGNEITIYQLLTHTSGLNNWYEGKMPEDVPENFPLSKNPHKFLAKMHDALLFKPGKLYNYSNSGYVLLGEIIEKLSGLPYESYLASYIFKPSGMEHTEMERVPDSTKNWITGYALNEDKEVPFIKPVVYPMPFSAGALRSTASDLLKFIKAFNTDKLVSKESRNKMTSYSKTIDGTEIDESVFYYPEDYKKPKTPKGIERFGYGVGFSCIKMYGEETISHSGFIAGFKTLLIHVPKSNTSFSILFNTELTEDVVYYWNEIQRNVTQIN